MNTSNRIWLRALDRRCQAAREVISAELDGEASEIESAAARRHRAQCADCDQFAVTVAATTATVRSAAPLRPSRRPMALPGRRAVSRGAMAGGFVAAMLVAALLGTGLAAHVTQGDTTKRPHVIYVADGEPDRALVAREQMLLSRTLGRQPVDLRRLQRLG